MKFIIISLICAGMSFANKLDSLDNMIDTLYQLDSVARIKSTDTFNRYKNEYLNEYKPHATRIILKQYKAHFPESIVNGDTTIYSMMERSMGTWFPNILKLQSNSEACIIKSIFVKSYGEKMNWNQFLSQYTYYRCVDKIASTFKYEYKKSAN